MGGFLASKGMGANIGWFYSIQGVVSIFMPAIGGYLGRPFRSSAAHACHLPRDCRPEHDRRGIIVGSKAEFSFWEIFSVYTLSVAAYMPTWHCRTQCHTTHWRNTISTRWKPSPIRIFGTIGFIVSMLAVDFLGWQHNSWTVLCFCWLEHRSGTLCADSPSMSHSSAQYKVNKKGIVDMMVWWAYPL